MASNGTYGQRRLRTLTYFAMDAALFFAAFAVGSFLRLGAEDWQPKMLGYGPGVLVGALVFTCAAYIFGLYSGQDGPQRLGHALRLAAAFSLATAAMLGLFYAMPSVPIGRGVLLISIVLAFGMSLCHHSFVVSPARRKRDRVALVIADARDELQAWQLESFWSPHVTFVGTIHFEDYTPSQPWRIIGTVDRLDEVLSSERIDRLLCTDDTLNHPRIRRHLCAARYSGIAVTPFAAMLEEIHQCTPIDLIRTDWLLQASSYPHLLYITKLKRAFDISISIALLVATAPLLLAAMMAVRVSSAGPVFYQQTRVGRFGREFRIIKLRTMRVNAEAGGPMWATSRDPRQTPVGAFLRKYRIDEIPQLWNILRGEMSFVGPRPERPEFVGSLSSTIPFYGERLMVQPGLTGWAQVNYPYGASADDARRKLEYDLYYMKNMSVFLDLLILLDTVRIVLQGGAHNAESPVRLARTPADNEAEGRATDVWNGQKGFLYAK